MKKLSFLVILILNVLFFVNCNVATEPATPLKYPEPLPALAYKFDYNPEKIVSNIKETIALVAPQFTASPNIPDEKNIEFETIANEYLNALKSDFQETLIAKGYNILGPYSEISLLTYGEKEKAILSLIPRIVLSYKFTDLGKPTLFSEKMDGKIKTEKNYQGVTFDTYRVERIAKATGTMNIDCTIELEIYEPLTSEKMWVKQIKIPFEQQPYEYYLYVENYDVYQGGLNLTDMLLGIKPQRLDSKVVRYNVLANNDGRTRALAMALENVYINQLNKFSQYFDPREIKQVIKDARKVRTLKRY